MNAGALRRELQPPADRQRTLCKLTRAATQPLDEHRAPAAAPGLSAFSLGGARSAVGPDRAVDATSRPGAEACAVTAATSRRTPGATPELIRARTGRKGAVR